MASFKKINIKFVVLVLLILLIIGLLLNYLGIFNQERFQDIGSIYELNDTSDILTVNLNPDSFFDLTNPENITTIKLGQNVTVIPNSAFENFTNLREVIIDSPSTLENIGSHAFKNCIKLSSFPFKELNNNINLGIYVFENTGFNNITVLDYMNDKQGIFYNTNLKSIVITSDVNIVGKNMFKRNLQNVNIYIESSSDPVEKVQMISYGGNEILSNLSSELDRFKKLTSDAYSSDYKYMLPRPLTICNDRIVKSRCSLLPSSITTPSGSINYPSLCSDANVTNNDIAEFSCKDCSNFHMDIKIRGITNISSYSIRPGTDEFGTTEISGEDNENLKLFKGKWADHGFINNIEDLSNGADYRSFNDWNSINYTLKIELDTDVPICISGYELITANDNPHRDPVRWKIELSENNVDFVTISDQYEYDDCNLMPTERHTSTGIIPINQNHRSKGQIVNISFKKMRNINPNPREESDFIQLKQIKLYTNPVINSE